MSDDRLFSLQDNSIYRQHYDLLKYNNASNRWDTIIFYDSLPFGSSPVLTDNSGNLYQNDYKALLRTTNYGKSWDTLTNKKNICSEEYIVLLTNSADRLYYENWRGIIYTTTDSGKNWDMIDLPFVKHKIESIYPINKDNLLILTDDKLFYSVDGCNNFRLSFAVCTTYTELGKIIKTNNGLYCNYQSSLLHSTDNGSNWVYVIEYFMDYLDFDIDRNGIIYSGYHGISKSSDDGFTWVQINGDLPKSTSYFPYVQALCINNKHELIVSIYDSGFYKSTDDGTTWKLVNKNYNRFGNILSHNNNLYAFTDDYGYYNLDDTNNIIYKSDDYGDSWKEIKFALPNSKFKYYLSPNGYLFASDVGANPQGLYQSIDGGLTWNIFDTNFDSKCIPAVFIEDNGTMWCGTDSGSVYRSKEPVVSVKEQQIFENIILAPNPVNDFLYITGMDNQKIEIFSIEGIKVFESIDPVSKIDVSGFAPGVYFLKARDKVNKFVKM